jgi:DNA polymerase-3 subunit beta
MTAVLESTSSASQAAAPFQVIVAREALQTALGHVMATVAAKTTLPVLSTVRLDLVTGGVRLTTTDLSTTTVVVVPADHAGVAASVLAPARKLYEVVSNMPPGALVLSRTSRGSFQVVMGKTKIVLAAQSNVDEFPQVAPVTGVTRTLLASFIQRLADRVAFAASTEESRPILNGVLLEPKGDTIRAVGTNGHRLAVCSAPFTDANPQAEAFPALIVPPAFLAQVRRVFAPEESVTLTANSAGFQLSLVGATASLTTRLIEGPYPDYERVFPTTTNEATFDVAAFIAAIKRVRTVSTDSTHKVTLTFEKNMVRFGGNSADIGEASDELPVHYTGDLFRIGFNAQYLVEVLGKLGGSDEARIAFSTPERATELTALTPLADGATLRLILMPARIID